ncbi:hypothetical protein [Roseobacter sp. CCS2]|uniref:hypothetical protein n=1 Tax=Roseobacter sp. CCS2 TaxID=391593 RepID=UPI0000F40683|nr:hypothetical protein [Roseobacter sp. CCS2]EBA11387.1 hypothetical protein RCCS2_01973 [Roseobacter sp. CCS2]
MADMNATVADFSNDIARTSPFEIDDVFWGYKVKSGKGAPFSVMFGQAICFFFGVCLVTATLGVLVLPTLFFDGGLGIMRIGAATLMGAAGFYLLWFASRGTLPEIHVDTRQNEVREVVCNRSGRPTMVAAYTFDEIGGIFLEPDAETGQSQLLLGYRDTAQTIAVAAGTEAQLLPLRDRLARDLLGVDALAGVEAA